MPVWIVIGVAAAVFVLVFVVAATFNVFSAETADEAAERWSGLPEDFTSSDLDGVRFRPALRGYRMEDVDEAIELLRRRLRELEPVAAETSTALTANDTAPSANDAAPVAGNAAPAADDTAAGPR